MEANASVYQVNPVSRITGEGKADIYIYIYINYTVCERPLLRGNPALSGSIISETACNNNSLFSSPGSDAFHMSPMSCKTTKCHLDGMPRERNVFVEQSPCLSLAHDGVCAAPP